MHPPNVATNLSALERVDLIRRLRELEEVYQFKHNLIQESAYSSLLRNDRRALHLRCAHALEEMYPADLDENAALLATHYAEAGDDAKTFEYARRAGEAAMRVHALPEALMHYDTVALLASRLPISTQDLLDVHLKRARVLEVMGKYADAAEAYRVLAALGQSRGEPEIEMGALLSLATLYIYPNDLQDLDQALRVNQIALDLARDTRDERAQARALWNMQQHAYFSGNGEEAVAYSKQALEITDRLDLREQRAYILNDVSRSLLTTESVTAALDALAQARAYWRETNNLPMLVDNLSTTCETSVNGGLLDMAEKYGNEARDLSRAIGNTWNLAYSMGNLMQFYSLRGESRRALETGAEVMAVANVSGFYIAATIARVQTAGIWGALGQPERAIEYLESQISADEILFSQIWKYGTLLLLHLQRGDIDTSRAVYERTRAVMTSDDLSTYGPLLLALGGAELALQEHRYADAVQAVQGLLGRMRKLGVYIFFPDLVLHEGRAYLGLGELDAARQVLDEGERVTREMRARPLLWQLLAAKRDLEMRLGNLAAAQSLRLEAQTLIYSLADDAPEEFRASFLVQRQVRALLDS